MTDLIYSIPVAQASSYQGQPVILRAANLARMSLLPARYDEKNILYIRLYGLAGDQLPANILKAGIAIDYVLDGGENQAATLYRLSRLLPGRDLRISIPMLPGFSRTVKLAAALNFAVKLEFDGPFPGMSAELNETMVTYLHQTTVCQPIDFFHSLLIHFIHQNEVTLWQIQEEDPAFFRQINEQGEELMPGRLAGDLLPYPPSSFVSRFNEELQATDSECGDCAFMNCCGGYFKWPARGLSCEKYQLQEIFRTLQQAAEELTRDQEKYDMDVPCRNGD